LRKGERDLKKTKATLSYSVKPIGKRKKLKRQKKEGAAPAFTNKGKREKNDFLMTARQSKNTCCRLRLLKRKRSVIYAGLQAWRREQT